VNSLQRQIDQHLAKLADPESAVDNWEELSPQEQQGLLSKWRGDVERQQAQQQILQGLLDGRTP
jgi:hypothetical protein